MKAARTAAIAVVASSLVWSAAVAGDFAAFRPIGFSQDGAVFAFEEYGIQDGSGFPYSNLFFLDTRNDAFLPGTPIRVRIDDEEAGLATARAESRAKADALIAEHGLEENPGLLAAFNPVTEIGPDPRRLSYRQHAVDPPFGGPFTLELQEVDLPVPEKCRDITPDAGKGFRLRLTESDGQPADRVIHEDTHIPQSRNCPVAYQLSGAMTFHPRQGPRQGDAVHVALVLVRSFGFEGNDGRWVAVPVRP